MSPQEKAKELIGQFLKLMQHPKSDTDLNRAKQRALIAVDEIIDSDIYIESQENIMYHNKYWQQVKQSLNNTKQADEPKECDRCGRVLAEGITFATCEGNCIWDGMGYR